MIEFKYLQTTNTKQHSKVRRNTNQIKYIVIHETGNYNATAGAMGHYKYLNNATRLGSAHFYVDDKLIVQTIGDSMIAWAIGDTWASKNKTMTGVTNSNSISIELCVNSDSNYNEAYNNTVELTKNLMKKFNIPATNVVRHFDATGKPCPNSMKTNNWKKWWEFKQLITEPMEYIIDTNKDSVIQLVGEKDKEVEKVDYNKHWAKKHWDYINKEIPNIMTEQRFDETITRGEVAKIVDCILKHKDK